MWCFPLMFPLTNNLLNLQRRSRGWHWRTNHAGKNGCIILYWMFYEISLWSQHTLFLPLDSVLRGKQKCDLIFLFPFADVYRALFLWVIKPFCLGTSNNLFMSLHVAFICSQWWVQEIFMHRLWRKSWPCCKFIVVYGFDKGYFLAGWTLIS